MPIRSSESPRSWIVNASSRPIRPANWRNRRAPMLWKVPAQGRLAGASIAPRLSTRCSTLPARLPISVAARREKVSSKMRCGSAPATIKRATLCASVLVLPEPAPAITSSGRDCAAGSAMSCSTASRWATLRLANGSSWTGGSATADIKGQSDGKGYHCTFTQYCSASRFAVCALQTASKKSAGSRKNLPDQHSCDGKWPILKHFFRYPQSVWITLWIRAP